jgi:hypothetical protein
MALSGSLFTILLLCIPVGFLGGLLIVFPVALPPVRKLLQRFLRGRAALVIFCGVFVFIASYLFWTRFMAKPLNPVDSYWDSVDMVTTNELWLRQIVPPFFSNPCYTGQSSACTIADNLPFRYGQPSFSNYTVIAS